jgi:hypothetical protein
MYNIRTRYVLTAINKGLMNPLPMLRKEESDISGAGLIVARSMDS